MKFAKKKKHKHFFGKEKQMGLWSIVMGRSPKEVICIFTLPSSRSYFHFKHFTNWSWVWHFQFRLRALSLTAWLQILQQPMGVFPPRWKSQVKAIRKTIACLDTNTKVEVILRAFQSISTRKGSIFPIEKLSKTLMITYPKRLEYREQEKFLQC